MVSCPSCGRVLTFISEYNRYYCYSCGQYAPLGIEKAYALTKEEKSCPTCGKILTFVPQYNRYYCHTCLSYAPVEKGPAVKEEPCPSCGKPLTYAPQYDRYYCFSCKAYAPLEKKEEEKLPERKEEVPVEIVPPKVEVPEKEAVKTPKEERPPLVRDQIEMARKSELIELCKAYGLNTSGVKYDLKQRLFDYMDEHGISGFPEEVPEETPEKIEEIKEEIPEVEKILEAPPEVEEVPAVEKKPILPIEEVKEEVPPVEVKPIPPVEVRPLPPKEEAKPPLEKKIEKPCPTCGQELTFVPQYDRHYCYRCSAYAPEEVRLCPTCKDPLAFVPQYNRHYCYRCQKYAPIEVKEVVPEKKIERPCPSCGQELTFITQYNRYYCYRCLAYPEEVRKVVPEKRVVKPCPRCGRELSHIAQYDRYYCYNCRAYAPEEVKHPCPTCGRELSYIVQYKRFYCYSCGLYAPEERKVAPVPTARPVTQAPAKAVALPTAHPKVEIAHKHGSPMVGISLMIAGFALYVVYEVLWNLPSSLGMAPVVQDLAELSFTLRFLGFAFIIIGAITSILLLRTRR